MLEILGIAITGLNYNASNHETKIQTEKFSENQKNQQKDMGIVEKQTN